MITNLESHQIFIVGTNMNGGHYGGASHKSHDKECFQKMRIVKAYRWTKEDSVKLAIFAAELVIDIFEKQYPDDKRPRMAIEAAKKWLDNPTADTARAAADAAAAAYAAYAAAAYAAARRLHYKKMADKLISLLKEAK